MSYLKIMYMDLTNGVHIFNVRLFGVVADYNKGIEYISSRKKLWMQYQVKKMKDVYLCLRV